MSHENNNLVLIVGETTTGKTASLRNLEDQAGAIYLQCETNKKPPFKPDWKHQTVTDPRQVRAIIQQAEQHENVHTVIVDTVTFLMDMYESKFCVTATDGRKAWGEYAQFWKKLMQDDVANSTKNIIMLAHTMDILDENQGIMKTRVKVKGSVMNQGIEAYFCNVIACKKMTIRALEGYANPLLNITDEEQALGFKYVYQTKLTKQTVNENIRGPLGMWSVEETFIDNDVQLVLNRLHEYYGDE